MADSKEDEVTIVQEAKKITVQVKTHKEKQSVEIEENATVKKFKEAISLKFSNAPVENLCLIFAGKIMKDAENLHNHHVKDGMTVLLAGFVKDKEFVDKMSQAPQLLMELFQQ